MLAPHPFRMPRQLGLIVSRSFAPAGRDDDQVRSEVDVLDAPACTLEQAHAGAVEEHVRLLGSPAARARRERLADAGEEPRRRAGWADVAKTRARGRMGVLAA